MSLRLAKPVRSAPGKLAAEGDSSAPQHDGHELRRNLCSSTADGVSFSVMVGVGESYFPAFVLALGLGDVAAGLITTVPLAAGAVLQTISPVAVRWFGSHRRWVVFCAALQALCFLPLSIGALMGHMSALPVF